MMNFFKNFMAADLCLLMFNRAWEGERGDARVSPFRLCNDGATRRRAPFQAFRGPDLRALAPYRRGSHRIVYASSNESRVSRVRAPRAGRRDASSTSYDDARATNVAT